MNVITRERSSTHIDSVAQLLNQVVDAQGNTLHAHELIDEISQLLWAVSSLDPETEHLPKHPDHVANLTTRAQG